MNIYSVRVLVTSLEFQSNLLCYYAVTFWPYTDWFCNAKNIAKSEYVTVPERIGQNEEPASKNEERAGKEPCSAPKVYLNEAKYHCIYFSACNYGFSL